MSASALPVAVVQLATERAAGVAGADGADPLATFDEALERAKAAGASLVVFPELADVRYDLDAAGVRTADAMRQWLRGVQASAQRHAVAVVVGGVEVRDEGRYDTAWVVDARGRVVDRYRKIHLFGGGARSEAEVFRAGQEPVICDVAGIRVGLLICYDLRFPEHARRLRAAGAELLVACAAFPRERSAHWTLLLQARAVENQCYVAAANLVGPVEGAVLCGRSALVSPDGALLAAAGDKGPECIQAVVDLPALHRERGRFPVWWDAVVRENGVGEAAARDAATGDLRPATASPRLSTLAVHAGSGQEAAGGLTTPIFRSSMYRYRGESYHEHGYIRLSNTPNHAAVTEKIARLEEAEDALVAASGMAAIATTLFALLEPGDAVLTHHTLYGGTLAFLGKEARRFGIDQVTADATAPDDWEPPPKHVSMVYVETVSNPLLEVADLDGVIAYARRHGLICVVDNTFASPVNCQPAALGADLVLESCSKYMNGHSDIVGGSVAGRAVLVAEVKRTLDHLGACMDPQVAWLLERGLKTLPARMALHNQGAATVANRLAGLRHPRLERVRYPGLPGHPQEALARRQLRGFGGMIALDLAGGDEAPAFADRFLAALRTFTVAVSLGGPESLAIRPGGADARRGADEASHVGSRVGANLVRLSVGLEDPEDLVQDLLQALDAAEDDGP